MAEVFASLCATNEHPGRHINCREVTKAVLKAATALTTSYVATDHVICASANIVTLELTYTHGSAPSIQWYLEWSSDGTNWFRDTNVATSTGTNTVTENISTFATSASTKITQQFTVKDYYLRANYKSTTNADGTLAIKAILLSL